MLINPSIESSRLAKKNAVGRREFLASSSQLLIAAAMASAFPRMAQINGAMGNVLDRGSDTEMRIQRLSWAGVKIDLGTTTILIDPLQDPALLSKGPGKKFAPIESTKERSYVLITHLHRDHYDPVAARSHLGQRGFVVCHDAVAATVAADGIRVRGVALHDTIILGDLSATAVEAVDGLGDDQVSWIVSGGGRRIIHCGDTLWHGYWWKLRQYGPFDVAFLPINGVAVLTRTPPSGLPADLTPEQASAAGQILGARVVCPMHYGESEPPGYVEVPDPEGAFKTAAKARNIAIQIVKPGDWVQLPKRG